MILLLLVMLLLPPTGGPDPSPEALSNPHSPEGWINLVSAEFPSHLWGDAIEMIRCESGGDPGAVNQSGSGALGLFQIKPEFWGHLLNPGESLLDPRVNIRVGAVITGSTPDDPWKWWGACKDRLSRPAVWYVRQPRRWEPI